MKRFLTITISIALLVLCYAALDDITTGSQPTYALEWMSVWLTVIWFVGLLVARIARKDT